MIVGWPSVKMSSRQSTRQFVGGVSSPDRHYGFRGEVRADLTSETRRGFSVTPREPHQLTMRRDL